MNEDLEAGGVIDLLALQDQRAEGPVSAIRTPGHHCDWFSLRPLEQNWAGPHACHQSNRRWSAMGGNFPRWTTQEMIGKTSSLARDQETPLRAKGPQ